MTASPEATLGRPKPRESARLAQAAVISLSLAAAFTAYLVNGWSSPPTTTDTAATGSINDRAPLREALGDIPNVTTEYYTIEATDVDGIVKEKRAKGPLSNGKKFGAHTYWRIKWHWDALPGGGCGVAYAQTTFEAKVTFPRLAHPDALTPQVAQHWGSYIDALARHEANHVRYAYEAQERVLNAVRSSSCAEANAAGHRVLAELREAQARYDRQTNHGETEGASFRSKARGFLSAIFNRDDD